MGTTMTGTQNSIVNRMIGAAMLNVNTYEEVEADTTATGQAAVVVGLVALCNGIGHIVQGGVTGLVMGIISAFIGWLLWAFITYFVGTKLFGGTATWGELLRTVGFAQSPGVLNILAIIPVLGWLVVFVVAIWQLFTGVVAIRQALDISTGKAVVVALISVVAVMILTGILFGGAAGLGALHR